MVSVANRRSVMVLYSDNVNPVGHSVRIVLAEKDINVEVNYISDDDRPETQAQTRERDEEAVEHRSIRRHLDAEGAQDICTGIGVDQGEAIV